jgi:uncharacterized protein (TIGR02265 family)
MAPREFLRALGWEAFPGFRSTVAGKVLLAAAGSTLTEMLRASGRAYAISVTPGTLTPEVEAGRAVLALRGIATFADSFHVGVFEGVLRAYEGRGRVLVRRHSIADVDLLLEWD